jgi:hypothetical protein
MSPQTIPSPASVPAALSRPQIAVLTTHAGLSWRVGFAPPMDPSETQNLTAADAEKLRAENAKMRVHKIFFIDDMYELYVFPTDGSALAQMAMGVLYRLSPFAVKQTMAFASIPMLHQIMEETEEEMNRSDNDGGDWDRGDDSDEEEDEEDKNKKLPASEATSPRSSSPPNEADAVRAALAANRGA